MTPNSDNSELPEELPPTQMLAAPKAHKGKTPDIIEVRKMGPNEVSLSGHPPSLERGSIPSMRAGLSGTAYRTTRFNDMTTASKVETQLGLNSWTKPWSNNVRIMSYSETQTESHLGPCMEPDPP